MSPASGGRPGQRSGAATFFPLVGAVCVLIAVREALEAIFPGLSPWVVFIIGLALGWLAYTGIERWYANRDKDQSG